ncbi:hypothetical protein TWF730_007124 [Orbilia blumenaviensis]|uniref:Uncharacterized protein n=1 Tax=Orbilia blumenaviensis TaxID=1796055 RepID=A0AAV9VIK9_9PEZI
MEDFISFPFSPPIEATGSLSADTTNLKVEDDIGTADDLSSQLSGEEIDELEKGEPENRENEQEEEIFISDSENDHTPLSTQSRKRSGSGSQYAFDRPRHISRGKRNTSMPLLSQHTTDDGRFRQRVPQNDSNTGPDSEAYQELEAKETGHRLKEMTQSRLKDMDLRGTLFHQLREHMRVPVTVVERYKDLTRNPREVRNLETRERMGHFSFVDMCDIWRFQNLDPREYIFLQNWENTARDDPDMIRYIILLGKLVLGRGES